MSKEGAKEFAQWRKSYDRWRKSITLTPDELAATRKVAESHHVHEFSTEVGVTALFTTCACGFRHAIFKDWVQQPRRVMGR